jgi:glycosyltransferase involved in cell wall biosynthesis
MIGAKDMIGLVHGRHDARREARREARSDDGRARHVLLVVENVSLARDHRLRKQVTSLLNVGYRVSVICRRDPANREFPGIRLYEYPAPADAVSKVGYLREYGYSLAMAGRQILRVFGRDPFDIIQISGTPDIYFLLAAPFRLAGCRVILDQRDLSPELYELRYGRRDLIYRSLCVLEHLSYRTVHQVITVNNSLKDVAVGRGGRRPESVTVVGNGPVLARTIRRPDPSLKHGKLYLCCWVGIMGPQDEVDLALRAVHELVYTHGRTDCHFSFIGDGDARADALTLASALGVEEFVDFPGWLSESDVFRYLSTADLALEPNLEPTVSPVKGMEYMAFAVPFVAFDLPETRRLAGPAASYADPEDVVGFANLISELLDDPARRILMGRLGRQRIERRLAWDHQQKAYLAVYQHLLGIPRTAPTTFAQQRRNAVVR